MSNDSKGFKLKLSSMKSSVLIIAMAFSNEHPHVSEAREYTQLDKVSSFSGEIIDRYCFQRSHSPITGLLCNYINLVKIICCKNMLPDWKLLKLKDSPWLRNKFNK